MVAAASEARSEPKASEVHRAEARSEPKARGAHRGWRRLGSAVLIGLVAAACSGREAGEVAMTESAMAPEFTLPDLDGKPVHLSDFRGKTVVIDFWATWCPPCVFQVPELNKFWEANHEAGDVTVLGVAVDAEGASVVVPWVKEQGVRYQILIGSESLAKDFGALGFPTLVIVKPDGVIDSLHVGLIEVAELEKILAAHRVAGS
jgi:peroxiredoxin